MLSRRSCRIWSVATGNGIRRASALAATNRMMGTGIGTMTRRLSMAARTSRVISRYVQ